MTNIFKVNKKNNRTSSGGSIVNFEHILHFIIIIQSNKCRLRLRNYKSQTVKFISVTERNFLPYGLGEFVGLHIFVLFDPTYFIVFHPT